MNDESHSISSGNNSTDTDDEYVDIEPHSASPVYSPRRLAEANFSPRGLHNMQAEDSFDEDVMSPRSTPQILHRMAMDTPPFAEPLSSNKQPESGLHPTDKTPSFSDVEPTAKTRAVKAHISETPSNASNISTTSERRASSELLPVPKSSILKNRTSGEEIKADGSKNSLRRDSHVQFKKEVRKVDILTDGDHDSEVSESVIDINDSANPHVDLRSNSSLIVNAMLHALVNKFGSSHRDKEKPGHAPIERESAENMRESSDVAVPFTVSHTEKQKTFTAKTEQKDAKVVEPEQPVVSPRRELVSSSMPNMGSMQRVPDDTDRSVSIEVIIDDQESDREIDESLTSPSGHGFIIKEETTLTEFILRILEEIEASLKGANTEIRQLLAETIQKLDAKKATSKSEPNMRVTPDLHKLLRSASAQIIKGTEADDVQGVRQVVSSLLSFASVKSELSGYEADGEDGDETEKSSMFVQTSDDTSDEPNPRTRLDLGDRDMLPGDETKTDTFNRVMQWRQALKDVADNRGGSSTESDLSGSTPTEVEKLDLPVTGSPPKLLSNHLVMRVQEEEKKQDADGFMFPVVMSTDTKKYCPDEKNPETPDTRRRSSILKHGGVMDQLKKDSHVQFKDDVIKVDVFTDGSDEAEISTSVVDLNDDSEHKKPFSCDEDILNQLVQYMSSCDEDEKSSLEGNGSLFSVSVVADSLINAFLKQAQRRSSDDVRFNHNAEESTFQNQMETVHLNLPTESPQVGEIEAKEQEAKWKEPLSTSMQDMRPKIADFDLMGKSASVEVIMDDAKFGKHKESQSEAQKNQKEASGVEITNKILNRLQLEENRPTDAVIHPQVILHAERPYTAEELYYRIKEWEEIPVPKTSSTSSSEISEKSTASLSSKGSEDLQLSVTSSGSITKSPSQSSDSITVSLTLDSSDQSSLLGSSSPSNLSSRISVTPIVSDSTTVTIVPSEEVALPPRHEGLSDASDTQIPTATSESKTAHSSSESSLDIISDVLSNAMPLSEKEKPGPDDNQRGSELEIAVNEESLENAFANWLVQQMPLKDLINEYEEWKEMKKRGGDKKDSESNKISKVAERHSAPCMRNNEKESVTAARNTYSTSGIGSKLALSELFGQLLLFDGIDTECGDVVEVSSSSQISDPRLSDEYADDEGSDTTAEFPEKENIEYAIHVSEIPAEFPRELDIPARPHLPSPPVELNTSVILSSLKKSLEKLDLQLTAGVPFVDLTKLPFTEHVKQQHIGERTEEPPPIDNFPARDRLLKLIRRQPFNLEPVGDSVSEEQNVGIFDERPRQADNVVGIFDERPGHKLLELIKCMPNAEHADTEKQDSKTLVDAEVQSDDTASQKSDETDHGHSKLLKLIASLDKFGLFLPTALGHPSLTDLPSRDETKTDLKKKADAENETCLAGDWVIVHIEDVPDVEMIMRKSAEDVIDEAIEKLENVGFEEENGPDTKPIWDKTVSEGIDEAQANTKVTDALQGISSLPAYFSPEEKSKEIQILDEKKVKKVNLNIRACVYEK